MLYLFSPEAEHKLKDISPDLVSGQSAGDMPQVCGDCRCCVTQVWSQAQGVHRHLWEELMASSLSQRQRGIMSTLLSLGAVPVTFDAFSGFKNHNFHLLSHVCYL